MGFLLIIILRASNAIKLIRNLQAKRPAKCFYNGNPGGKIFSEQWFWRNAHDDQAEETPPELRYLGQSRLQVSAAPSGGEANRASQGRYGNT